MDLLRSWLVSFYYTNNLHYVCEIVRYNKLPIIDMNNFLFTCSDSSSLFILHLVTIGVLTSEYSSISNFFNIYFKYFPWEMNMQFADWVICKPRKNESYSSIYISNSTCILVANFWLSKYALLLKDMSST